MLQQTVLFMEKLHPDFIPYVRDRMIYIIGSYVCRSTGVFHPSIEAIATNSRPPKKLRLRATGSCMLTFMSGLIGSTLFSMQTTRV